MATYVPNVNPYLPNVKAFTPDYKFLTDTLQQRQTKYDTNYKQLNNAYSKIMYAGLSRQDTKEARDQFVNNLQPELEKISGLDLSLGQNVRAAQAVFQPFYDNDLVVKDMVMTKDFENKMAYAQQLASSTNEEESDRYWDEGVQLLKYKMDDFINASQDEALATQLPSYIENPRLYKRAMDYFNKQGYKVKYDRLSPGNDFIITDTNGKNITSTALADLKMRFQNNDVIKKGYYAKSYVDSRNFANNQMKSGNVSSIAEGILKYNTGTLQTYKAQNEMQVVKYNEQITTLNSQLESINDQLKGQAVKPGSATDNNIKLLENQIQGLEMQKEMAIKTATKADNMLSSGNAKMINQGAYNVQMQSNIDKDLRMAANNYSMLTAERTIKVNQAELQRRNEVHDVKMSNMRFKQDARLKEIETEQQAIREENKIKLQLKYGITPEGKAIEGSRQNEINKIKNGLNLPEDSALIQTKTSDIKEEEQQALDVYQSYLTSKETQIADNIIDTYLESVPRHTVRGYKNLIKVPDSIDVRDAQNKYKIPGTQLVSDGKDVYVNADNFRKIVNSNEKNYELFAKENDNYFENLQVIDTKTSRLKTKYEQNKENQTVLKNSIETLNKTQAKNLDFIFEYENMGKATRVAGENKDGTHYILSPAEFAEEFRKKELKNADYRGNLNVVRSTRYPLLLKAPDDIVWDKLRDGQIKPYVGIVNENGNTVTIVNPELVSKPLIRGQGSVREATGFSQEQLNEELKNFVRAYPHPERDIDIDKLHYRGWGEKINNTNLQLFKMPAGTVKLDTKGIQEFSSESYKKQLQKLDDVAKAKYEATEQIPFEAYNPLASDYGIQDPFSENADLFMKKSKSYILNNSQTKDAASIKNNSFSVGQAFYLLDALSEDGTQVTQDLGPLREQGGNDINLDNSAAKMYAFNLLEKYEDGELDKGYDYNITYTPGIGDDEYSTYTLTRTQDIKGTQTKSSKQRLGQLTIKVPVQKDKNVLNYKNDNRIYSINNLIDPIDQTYVRKFSNESSINVSKDKGQWQIDYNLMQYDPKTDEFTGANSEVILQKYGISPFVSNDDSEADLKYKQMVQWFSGWNGKQYDNASLYRTGFKNYLKGREPKEGDWEKYLKIRK